jgi:predicted hydrocarbon binding protein
MEMERRATEVLAGGRVRASIAHAHLRWVRDYHGEHAIGELFAVLPEPLLGELRNEETRWLSFESLIILDRVIERRFGRGRHGFLRELGRYSAHLNLATNGARGEAIHDFFHRATLLHAQFQDFGTAAYEELGLTSGRMAHSAYRCFSPVYCASAIGYYEQALVTNHAIPVRVEETSCQSNGDASCTFELEWA